MATDPESTASAAGPGDPAGEPADGAGANEPVSPTPGTGLGHDANPATGADSRDGADRADSRDGADRADPRDGADALGLREQIGAVIAAARRLVGAHVALARAEFGAIMGEVGRVAALGGLAFAMAFLIALLLPIGLILFVGDWLYGSLGWGVLLGTLLLIDIAVLAGLLAVGLPGRRLGVAFLAALALGIVAAIVLGLELTNRAWVAAGDEFLPGVDVGFRPLAIAVLSLAAIGAVIGLVGAVRAPGGSAVGGLVMGAFGGIVLGALTAVTLGPRVGAAFGTLIALVAWPVFMGLDASRTGIDGEALKARFYPNQTIETTKETIEWVRQRTPLGRKS